MQPSSSTLSAEIGACSPVLFFSAHCPTSDLHFVSYVPGAGKRGEGSDVIRPAPDQKALLVELHPHFGGTEVLLHARPGQRGLPHHDGAAGGDGIRHSRPKTAPV